MSKLTAMDIEKQEFSRKVRGFDPEEVRLYLRSVAEEVQRLNLQNGELLEEAGKLRQRNEEHRTHERTLQKTLISAQKMAEEMTGHAKSEAETLLRHARQRAEGVLQQSQDQLSRLEAEISRCKLERDQFEARLCQTIDEHRELLERRARGRDASQADNVVPHRRLGSEAG
jgi:cell division initiation protein